MDHTTQRRLVIVGDGEFAEIAYEYFTHDSNHVVAAFAVEPPFLKRTELFGLPVVSFENLEQQYPPDEFDVFVAVTFTKLNRVRTRLLAEAQKKGYRAVSYVSTRAFVWHNVQIGANCFIFENNVIQYHARLEDNVVLWSGNHIGHRAVIRANAFLSSHVVVSGYCEVGSSSFLGVNATIVDRIRVGEDCLIAAGAVVTRNAAARGIYKGNPASRAPLEALKFFGITDPYLA